MKKIVSLSHYQECFYLEDANSKYLKKIVDLLRYHECLNDSLFDMNWNCYHYFKVDCFYNY